MVQKKAVGLEFHMMCWISLLSVDILASLLLSQVTDVLVAQACVSLTVSMYLMMYNRYSMCKSTASKPSCSVLPALCSRHLLPTFSASVSRTM